MSYSRSPRESCWTTTGTRGMVGNIEAMEAPPALELRGLTKRYDDGLLALDRLDLAVPDGDVFDLRAKAEVRAPRLSGGMRRRLLLARALMHEPKLVILDEPTAGVDFELRMELWRYIRRLHGAGTTILLTTHYLEEAEELCEEIALLRGGALVARDTADALRDAYEAASLTDVYLKAMAG